MSILSENQRKILELLSKERLVAENFYLSGGTALAEFYLHHRLSEDLDFFSENEFEAESISVILKKISKPADIKSVKHEQSFNRNLFFLELPDDEIKTEFTYYPFPRIEIKKKINNFFIDSLLDIAVNKLFTIYQNPRSRDFIDLFFILKENQEWSIDDLSKKAQIKFDSVIDPLQLAAQFVKAENLRDQPKMLIKIDNASWRNFFKEKAAQLSKSQLI